MITSGQRFIGTQFASLKFIAAADVEEVIVTPRVTMKKGWDGRWSNTLASWFITLLVLYQINRRKVMAYYSAPTAASHLHPRNPALGNGLEAVR